MNNYSVITFISAVISLAMSIYGYKYRKSIGAKYFSFLTLVGAIYAFGYAFELTASSVEEIRFWLYVEYIGIPFIPTAWLLFAFEYTGKTKWINPKTIITLFSLSFSTLIFNYTNNFHHLFYRSIDLSLYHGATASILWKGPLYWIHVAFINIAILVGNLLFLEKFLRSTMVYRWQSGIIFFGSLFTWGGYLLYLLKISPEGLDITPLTFVITGTFYSWALFQYRLLDLGSIALEYVFESVRDGVILLDIDKRILNFNPPGKNILENYQKVTIGKPITSGFGEFSSKLISPQNIEEQKDIITIKNNDEQYIQLNISTIYDKHNRELGYVLLLSDVTIRQKTEQKLKELNATKDKFFSIIAHDLRNPLGSMASLVELATDNEINLSREDLAQILNDLKESSKSTYELLDNLLKWALSQKGEISCTPTPSNITDLINLNIQLFQANAMAKQLKLVNSTTKDIFALFDWEMINTVIRNLINNAIKYTGVNGTIEVSAIETDNYVTVSVKDTGFGMDEELIQKLFRIEEKLYSKTGTSGEKGSGLGLILCREFIEKHNCKIWAESKLNQGSSFCFTLPRIN